MKQWAALCAFVCLAAMPAVAATFDPAPYALDITTSRLANGLTVLVIRDVHVSDATVELWFRVGSGDETAEQHGLAHLFEHTLPGAKNVTTPVPNRLAQRRDSLDSNGSTAVDYTNMFQRVPATSIELPIAVFAERMSAAPESITDADLAANRDIVFAEFRNSIGRPWDAAVAGPMRRVLFGSDHPYGHAVIGTQLQLDALTTEDVRRWFRARYGAANTMLVVSGNVDPAQVVALAKKHFGSIAAGQSYPLALAPVTPRDRDESLALSVPQAKPSLTLAWRTPAWSDPSRQEVALAVELLRRRLTDALQCEVTEGYGFTGAAGGAAVLQLPCGDPSRARQLLSSFLTSTPDIAPVRDDRLADLSEQLQHLGWRSSRAQWVGEGLWLAGDAKAYLAQVERIATATPASVMRAAKTWLAHPLFVRIAPATVDAASDRAVELALPKPEPALPQNIVETNVHGVRVFVAKRALPLVIGRVVSGTDVTSFAVLPSRADAALADALKGKSRRDLAVILVGDIAAPAALLEALPPGEAATAKPAAPPFQAEAGATQTTLRAALHFADADAARIALAADLLRVRLNARLREKEHWTYNVDSRYEAPDVIIETRVKDENAVAAKAAIIEIVSALPAEALTTMDVARAQGAELRRLAMLASTAPDLADALVQVARSGDTFAEYVQRHRALYDAIHEGATLELPAPSLTWTVSGDPAHVDPALRQ